MSAANATYEEIDKASKRYQELKDEQDMKELRWLELDLKITD